MKIYNRRGDSKYDVIFSWITGILVMGIVIFWIFNVYFTESAIDWEVCRESLIIRNSMPEEDLGIMISSKGLLDLKCKTQVITIDYKDVEKAERIIGETISSCWYMVGRGNYKVFPGSSSVFSGKATPCIMCARIHMDSEVIEFYSEEKNNISLKRVLNSNLEGYDVPIWDYLNPEKGHQAIPYFKDWNDTGFNIDVVADWSSNEFGSESTKVFSFPKYFIPEKGDLFISYAEPVKEAFLSDERAISPYMIFLQADDFDMLSWTWASYADPSDIALAVASLSIAITNPLAFPATIATTFTLLKKSFVKVCSSWESVPS